MKYEFVFDKLTNYKNNIYREWLLTNGLGSYAGSSIIGSHMRTQQGYLIASIHPPVERFLVFSKTNERLVCGSRIYDLTTAQHKGPYASEFNQGNMHLKSFTYDGTVNFVYEAGGMRLTKTIALVQGKNQCVIAYTLENNGPAAGVVITPLMNYRDHGEHMTVESLKYELPDSAFGEIRDEATGNTGFYYSPVSNKNVRVSLVSAGCEMVKRNNIYDENMELQYELDNDAEALDCHLKPYDFVMEVDAGGVSRASFVCTVDVRDQVGRKKIEWSDIPEVEIDTAFIEIEKAKNRVADLIEKSGFSDEEELGQILTVAADQFIVDRLSTGKKTIMAGYPWFTDWGRDTMIAFTGLCLETGRYEDAKSILLSFSKCIKNGLVPNMFPDNGKEPLYNTADASLWYFYAVYNYLKYVDTDEAWKFVEDYIYSSLQEIMAAYRKGTQFSIGMDDDALMNAGSGLDQVTWMDVRIGDEVVTPRHGKPVEINALWYNALMTMEEISRGIARRTHDKPENYLAYAGGCSQLAMWVKEAFNEEFWYEEGGYLYDVIGEDFKDATLRPNQIFAVSLPFTMLDIEKEKSIVRVLKDRLYVGVGLRSLDTEDENYQGTYQGSLEKRDHAYHQGTAWGFLLGAFIESYLKVGGGSAQSIEEARAMFEPIEQHLFSNCIGSVSEIFDGDEPHAGRGCFAQAWSVGEILRAYALLNK
ncbi:glycogen debranching enzyme, putative [Pseudobutyrivibrio sp. NOR37]|uniref:4-alpha-glucanotransferase n=2 Tax=Pseudobutyrivibrio TaxID=46205 RepID=A0A2G3DY09_9FIRM|nr:MULTISPECIES: amylo-alpha-1,6-glucosidase [Pseudobutyrivibrio]NEX02690.1 4-alpha-glucanotransferase [Pseudobutyrivibrio xylanivorans]PHU35884.1 4-alpha-glucanotransferase [Pseudobutyrivibrio ruminis]SCY02201.1 glycogen debranching enzyme, putative [Pseudobutyrivibrio sp. AR14]SFR80351.1 glycogen debranching enzyme, putative [Pseudobutyrivibrio sp. NOR37]